jgi:hypothetical protein
VADTDGDVGRLEVFDQNDQLLARVTSGTLTAGHFETLEVARPTADIAYALVGGHLGSQIQLDDLRIGVDPTTETDSLGAFRLAGLDPGTYLVQLDLRQGWTNVSPQNGETTVTVGAGEVKDGVDFGVAAAAAGSLWQNPANPLDVDDDGAIAPGDVLWVAHNLYYHGSRRLPAPTVPPNAPVPYLDTNGDGYVSPVDVLLVARQLTSTLRTAGAAEVQAAPAATPAAGNQGVEGGAVGFDGGGEGEASRADGGSWSPASSALSLPAAPTEAPAQTPAEWEHLEAAWMIHSSSTEGAPAMRMGLQAASQLARPGSEPPGPDTGPSYVFTQPAVALLHRAGENPLVTLPRRTEATDASVIVDEVFSDGSWLEDLLSARLGETSRLVIGHA